MTAPARVLTASRTLTAVKGKALSFDGVDDYVDCGNDESLHPNHFTWEAWINRAVDDFSEDHIISPGPQRQFGIRNKKLWFYSLETGHFYGITELESNRWYHVAVTFDGTEVILYLNGKYENSATGSPAGTSGNVFIGQFVLGGDYYFNGTIDEVRIYERALSASEVLYNKEHPYNPILHGCVLWLGYDSIDEGAGIWRDKSGYGNNGTIYGATAVEMNKLAGRVLSV